MTQQGGAGRGRNNAQFVFSVSKTKCYEKLGSFCILAFRAVFPVSRAARGTHVGRSTTPARIAPYPGA